MWFLEGLAWYVAFCVAFAIVWLIIISVYDWLNRWG